MCQSDFRSACMGSSQTAVRLFFHEQAYTEYIYVQIISTIARGKSRECPLRGYTSMLYLSFSPKFSLGLSKVLNHVRYTVGLDMKYF